jgi:hypothetical protein
MSRWAARHYTTLTRVNTTRLDTTQSDTIIQSCRGVPTRHVGSLSQTRHASRLAMSCQHAGTAGTARLGKRGANRERGREEKIKSSTKIKKVITNNQIHTQKQENSCRCQALWPRPTMTVLISLMAAPTTAALARRDQQGQRAPVSRLRSHAP